MKIATPVVAAALAAALGLVLYGCGGGGGGSSSGPGPRPPGPPAQPPVTDPPTTPTPATAERLPFPFEAEFCDDFSMSCPDDWDPLNLYFRLRDLPDADIADARRSPVSYDWKRIFVGVDQGTEYVGALPVVTHRDDAEIRFGALDDGIGEAEVREYLSHVSPDRSIPDVRTVRIIGPSTQQERNRVAAAVRMVNAALPEAAKLDMDTERPDLSLRTGSSGEIYTETGNELPNTIDVEFFEGSAPAGDHRYGDAATFPDFGYVRIFNRATPQEGRMVITIAHEIMHTLGIDGHVPILQSIMKVLTARLTPGERPWPPMSALWPADREALRVLYGPDPVDFGPWSSTSLHIHGNAPHAGFGVAFRNGYAEPWAYGRLPAGGLETNDALSGSATWTGHLVGFTPDVEAVTGDAALTVDIAALTGTADFTGLEHWGVRKAPGEAGTGTVWGDGDLRYAIEAIGQTFRETDASDDAGRLTGVFTGPAHEGAAGTLERTDLTAAFGAARQ